MVPASEMLGALFAWHLYLDYYQSGGGADMGPMASLTAGLPDPMGKVVDAVDPEDYGSMWKGVKKQGEALTKQLDGKDLNKQLVRGGEALQQGIGAIGKQGADLAKGFAEPPPPPPPPAGK